MSRPAAPAGRFGATLPWLFLVVGLALATAPVWRMALMGFHPTVDDLLSLRCFAGRVRH